MNFQAEHVALAPLIKAGSRLERSLHDDDPSEDIPPGFHINALLLYFYSLKLITPFNSFLHYVFTPATPPPF